MKYAYSLLFAFLTLQAFAQSIPIQLMVVDQNGFEMPNTQVKLRLTMRGDTSLTTGQYQEVHNVSTNDLGVVSVDLGEGIVTTNSQVLDIDLFNFDNNEPYIKTELDTSISPTNYANLGWIRYHYPMISRRAFKADSADFAYQSTNSVFADTAQFALNFNESYDGDTSALNELQTLNYDANTNTISITSGNSISLASNSKVQVSSDLIPLEINQSNFYQWKVADSNFLYAFSGSNLFKAPISNPDSITSINVGFPITKVSPSDSIVFGVDPTYQVYKLFACDLYGQSVIDKIMGSNSAAIVHSWTSIKDSLISFGIQPYNSNRFLYTWNIQNNTLTSQQFPLSQIGVSDRFIIGKTGLYNQTYRIQTFDRFSNVTYLSTSTIGQYSNESLTCIDSTGRMLVTRIYSSSSQHNGFARILLDSTTSGFGIPGSSSYTVVGNYGHGLVTITSSDQMMYLFNPYHIKNGEPVSKLVLENWSANHPESSGSWYAVPGHDAFLIYFVNVENYWINGAFRSGDFLLTIPYES